MAAAKTILILESNPWQDLSLNQEIRDLTGVIERARDRDAFRIEQGLAVRTEDLQELMLRHEPQIVHFCGHGSGEDGLVLQDAAKQPVSVATDALSNLFGLCKDHVDCVVLNACYSEVQAEAIVEHVDYAIGMQQAIRDDSAQHFAQGFYLALGYGKSVEVAYEWGCNAIQLMLASEGDGRTRDSAIPQRRKISCKAVVEGGVQELPEYLKPRLFKRAALGVVEVAEVEQPSGAELEELEQALEQEDALEQYRERVREFLKERVLSPFAQARLRQFRRKLGLSEAEAAQILATEEALLQRAREEYREIVEALVESGAYPFDEQTLGELRQFREQLLLTEREVKRSEKPIFAAAEKAAQVELSQKKALREQRRQRENDLLQRSAKLRDKVQSTFSIKAAIDSIAWQNFEFERVRVDAKSKVVEREQRSAECFVERIGDGVELEMMSIPGGKFSMGAADREAGALDCERPRHRVVVPDFCLGRFAVTQAQYRTVMGVNPAKFSGEKHPVEQVSWTDAQVFCQKLSEKTKQAYRLPSEAEWEYACRAGTTTPFCFGEELNPDLANYGNSSRFKQTVKVGRFPANAFGLYDMHGNVWEWCADRWHSNYSDAPKDGNVWITALISEELYALRGGSWLNTPRTCRSAYRLRGSPSYRDYNVGFRVACVAPRAV